MQLPIKDLHCDLLEYLQQSPNHSPEDPIVRCSIPQLQEGGVQEQILAIFTETGPGSHFSGRRQVQAFLALRKKEYGIQWRLAIENGSAFFEEEESIQEGISRLKRWHRECGPFAYLSMTWNMKNRFGGGSLEPSGLTADGQELIRALAELGIPLDLAHASDPLAEEALAYLDQAKLSLPVLYSHGEARAVRDLPRNAPDWLIEEVIHRKGLIGLSLVCRFIGEQSEELCRHVEHILAKGGADHLCFGADFFFEGSIPEKMRRSEPYFFPEWANASCYPAVLQLLQQELQLEDAQLRRLASENVERFFQLVDQFSK